MSTSLIYRTEDGVTHFMDASSSRRDMKVAINPEIGKALNWSSKLSGMMLEVREGRSRCKPTAARLITARCLSTVVSLMAGLLFVVRLYHQPKGAAQISCLAHRICRRHAHFLGPGRTRSQRSLLLPIQSDS